jgi:transcriptional regulator with XRE-family HTH domain
MRTFGEFLKEVRTAAGKMSQAELAKALDVSTVLITMVETGKKSPSKKLVAKLAEKLEVRPAAIMPLLDSSDFLLKTSRIERLAMEAIENLQIELIQKRAPKLSRYANH